MHLAQQDRTLMTDRDVSIIVAQLGDGFNGLEAELIQPFWNFVDWMLDPTNIDTDLEPVLKQNSKMRSFEIRRRVVNALEQMLSWPQSIYVQPTPTMRYHAWYNSTQSHGSEG